MAEPTLSRSEDKPLAALTRAIYLGQTAEALALIAPGIAFDRIARGVSHTPLMAAIDNGNTAVFEALLAAGAGIGPQNEYGETALHAAAHRGDEAMALALLARGADVNERVVRPKEQVHGRTPLMGAATSGKLSMVKLLLERGADPMAKDVNGWTALTFAEPLNKRIAGHLCQVMNMSPQASDLNLFDAARAGLVARVRELLGQGTAADARDKLGRTALHWAAMGGNIEIVRMLLDAGAPADAPDKSGWTPLSLIEDSADVAKLLLERGADPNANHGGLSVLLYLASCRGPEVLAALLDAGGDPNAKDSDGRGIHDYAKSNSPRTRAFLKDRLEIARDAIDALYDRLKELPRLAKAPAFEAAAARLGGIFNRKPTPWRRRKGIVYFHDVSLRKRLTAHYGEAEAAGDGGNDQASRLLARLQDEVAAEGFVLAYTDAIPEEGRMKLILLPASDKYAALLASGTNGINYGHDAESVIRWLKDMEAENPFHLGGCGHDFLHGRFAGPIKNAEALAARMIEFCSQTRQMPRSARSRAPSKPVPSPTGWNPPAGSASGGISRRM